MAGIGFELQRVLRRGGFGSLLQVAFAGMVIVAGPWLLSIIGIFLITHYATGVLGEGQALFVAIVVYCYAFSLILFGGFHYLFTRIIADQIYDRKLGHAGASLTVFSGATIVVSALIALPFALSLNTSGMSNPLLFKGATVGLFAAINLLWIMMIFVSLLKKFAGIFLAYFTGLAISVAGTVYFGRSHGLGGSMAGFAFGQFAAALILAGFLLRTYRPTGFSELPGVVGRYLVRYRYLILSGFLYYWGMWADKLIFWLGSGQKIGGTFLRLYDPYDIPVYLASLTMIPGLVYFVVILETDFYIHLMRFLKAMERSALRTILTEKYRLVKEMRGGLREQGLFQAVISAGIIATAGFLLPRLGLGGVSVPVFDVLVGGVFFQLIFLTLVTLLFYLEVYDLAFYANLVFFAVNLVGSLVIQLSGRLELRGLGFLAGTVLGCVVAYRFLMRSADRLDRLVYARYSGDR